MAPCLLIPSPKEDDDHKDEVIAAIAKEVCKGTGEEEEFHFPEYCFYSLAERKVVSLNNVRSKSNIVIPDHAICVGSSHGWLAYLDPHECALFLTNPLVSPVPPTIRLPRLPRFLIPESCSDFKKLVMSCSPSSDNNDCTVMVTISCNCHNLVFCKVGDSSWTELEADHEVIVYSNKDQLFYSRNYYDGSKFAAWDLRNSCSPHRIDIDSAFAYGMPDYPESEKKQRERYLYGNWQHYLVVESHSGDVLLVSKYCDFRSPLRTIRIDVYRLNAPKRGWDYVTDLGDGVVFVGLNQAFHLSALDFAPGVLIPNSIYFTPENDKLDYEMGIYNMRDFTVTSFFPSHLHPFNKIHQPPPIWLTPNPWNN
ncbi:uncharacterized protein LOC132272678 [Cornus florida]|uniref:uncharacterized protein LOC132272678 n=1 Tax=Cornus florida TaxID=4283 RepID=UPI0028A0F5AC|nr:uncharacterized protein LOC132272678 [Cornus florida]